MINTNLMLGRKHNSDAASETPEESLRQPQPLKEEERPDNYYEEVISDFYEELTDPFDCLPPNEPQLDEAEEAAVREEQEKSGTEIPPISENTEFEAEIVPDEETVNNTIIIIDGIAHVLKRVSEVLTEAEQILVPKRKYKNVAKFDKISHAKPKESQPSIVPKLLIAGGASVAAGIWFGIEANSYFIANADKKPTGMQCTFGWIMQYDTLKINLSPLYGDIFFTAFGIVVFIMAVIIFFVWDSSAGKKRRREGKEHGDGRLATPSDFKKFKSRFMD